MSWRIFRNAVLVAAVVLLLCVVTFYGVLYRYYENEIYTELAAGAGYVLSGAETAGRAYFDGLQAGDRVTWIAADGTVLYDSAADAASMGNHLDREEVAQALAAGTGRSAHTSETLLQKTLYYARRGADGTVVRIARTQSSLTLLLLGTLRPILLIAAAALILSGLLASRLAKQIVRPINELDLAHPGQKQEYGELEPLVARLRQQNQTIHSQMAELGRQQRDFTAILENMNEGVLLADRKGNILSCNHSFLNLLGGGEAPASLFRMGGPKELRGAVEEALAGRRSECRAILGEKTYLLTASPVTASGQVTGAVAIAVDVTEAAQREALRQEFSAVVSHELKTPLTSISGFAELMMDGLAAPDKMKEFSGDIYRETRRLISLTDDLLRLSRLDAGDAPAEEWEMVDLHALADDILVNLKPAAEAKGVTLRLEGACAPVWGVWQVLNELLYNLCDNAVKYNQPGGSVTVTLFRRGSRSGLTVADTGIGIPKDQQARVFERFYRVDKSHSKAVGGTGLGLSIVKHGAQVHGAALSLESEPGKGTAVTVLFQEKDTI